MRRIWRCPACGRESRAQGDVVALRCGCTSEGTAMRLVEGRRQVRQFPRPPQAGEAAPEAPAEERSVEPPTPMVLSMEAAKLPDEPVDRSAIPETFGEGLPDSPVGDAAASAPADG